MDTLPECKVILDAIEDPSFAKQSKSRDHLGSAEIRFRHATQADLGWRERPEFPVRAYDIEFVMAAAERVIEEKNFFCLVTNIVTGRRKAAKNMLSFLETD